MDSTIFVLPFVAGVGPQNLNVISHAIKRNFAFNVATTYFIADSILIIARGIGLSVFKSKYFILLIYIICLMFIGLYLTQKCYSLFKKQTKFKFSSNLLSYNLAIVRTLILTFLNPILFIDTTVVIGGEASKHSGLEKIDFLQYHFVFYLIYEGTLMIYAIGHDIVSISRIEFIFNRYGERLLNKILSTNEKQILTTHNNKIRFLATRFAAKEAFAKACGTGLRSPILMPNIGIVNDILGKPILILSATVQQWLQEKSIHHWHLSISDESDIASAFVILETS